MIFWILSVIVEVYLWLNLQASLIFLSGKTCTIGGWLNTFLPQCIFRPQQWHFSHFCRNYSHVLLPLYHQRYYLSEFQRLISWNLFHRLHMLMWAILSTFLQCLIYLIALLGSLSEADMNILFLFELIVQRVLHTVNFLLGHTASVLTVWLWFIGTWLLYTTAVRLTEAFRTVTGT